jgi:hypothetical protein
MPADWSARLSGTLSKEKVRDDVGEGMLSTSRVACF